MEEGGCIQSTRSVSTSSEQVPKGGIDEPLGFWQREIDRARIVWIDRHAVPLQHLGNDKVTKQECVLGFEIWKCFSKCLVVWRSTVWVSGVHVR